MDSGSRFKLHDSRLVDAETGLLGLVAGYGSNWVEWTGSDYSGLDTWTSGGDGLRNTKGNVLV